jgi:diguanylate cyclase (GGDEF)-like protein
LEWFFFGFLFFLPPPPPPPMKVVKKTKSHKPRKLVPSIIFLVFIVLLISIGLFLFLGFTRLKKDVIEWKLEEMHTLVLAYSKMLDGDSIELDFKRKWTNAYYNKWNDVIDSLLKETGMKYFYVMNASYNDSIEFYIGARSHLGKPDFMEKVSVQDYDIELVDKLKNKSEMHVCKTGYYPEYGGWLAYSYISVKNSKGDVVAFVGADQEITDIESGIIKVRDRLLFLTFLFFIVVFSLIIYLIKKIFISPISKIIEAANNFHFLNVSFRNLDSTYISEYDVLIESFKNMEEKIYNAITKSFTDDLTKLNNRYFFTLSLENILKPTQQEKMIAFLIIDIDSFKQINDTYGHEKGDFVLRSAGIILKQVFGDLPGVVVRLGGDEFAVCLDGIEDKQIVEDKCELFKKELSQITYAEDKTGVSASVGVIITKFIEIAPVYKEIFSAADTNLYKVKAKGKNGYLISEI